VTGSAVPGVRVKGVCGLDQILLGISAKKILVIFTGHWGLENDPVLLIEQNVYLLPNIKIYKVGIYFIVSNYRVFHSFR
jgi:hypothetical protein